MCLKGTIHEGLLFGTRNCVLYRDEKARAVAFCTRLILTFREQYGEVAGLTLRDKTADPLVRREIRYTSWIQLYVFTTMELRLYLVHEETRRLGKLSLVDGFSGLNHKLPLGRSHTP